MNDMTFLLVMTVAAAFLTGALALPVTMPRAVLPGSTAIGNETVLIGTPPLR